MDEEQRPSHANAAPVQKHPVYYLPEGDTVVQAGTTLFRFDLSVLHSKSFVLQGILPSAQLAQFPRFDDAHPLHLLETSAGDLEILLQFLLPTPHYPPSQHRTPEQYLSLLSISSKYHIPTMVSFATTRLHTLPSPGLDPIRKIAIWDQYRLDPALLRSSYATLCQREQLLTLQMGLTLGVKRLTMLAAVREMYRERVGCKSCGKRNALSRKEKTRIAEEVIDQLFLKSRLTTEIKSERQHVVPGIRAPSVAV